MSECSLSYTDRMNARQKRAKPLSPDERRAAILDAVIPLLVERGAAVTTSEMAAAAGIAEGTIFRVFPDKSTLLHAAIAETMDPEPVRAAVASLDPSLPFSEQLTLVASTLADRFDRVTSLFGLLRSMPGRGKREQHKSETHKQAHKSMMEITEIITGFFASHADSLRVEPGQAALVLRALVFANTDKMLAASDKMSAEQIVAALRHGVV